MLLPDCPLRTLVAGAVQRAGAVALAYDEARLRAVASARIAAAVVELSRPLTSELARLQGISERLAHVPMLVYSTEAVVGVPDFCTGNSGTRRLRFASSASREPGINEDVDWLVRAISPCALTWLVTFLVRDIPLVGWGYIAEYLWQLGMGPADAQRDVATAAAALGTSRSVLEHLLKQKTSLPPPKELADWLTLLLVTYAARGLAVASHQVSTELSLDRHRWSRLQARLLRSYPMFPILPACTQFHLALVAFAERCAVARNRVVKVLRMAR